jgi:hypothetical protein
MMPASEKRTAASAANDQCEQKFDTVDPSAASRNATRLDFDIDG